MKTILYFAITCFVAMGLNSCSKQELKMAPSASYTTINFIDNSTLGVANFGVKYNGEPMGALVLAGPGKFTFYNKTTGEVLLEKELDVKVGDKEPWYFFQPDASIAPQLIRNTQKDEPAAPEGYMKLKIANLSKIGLANAAGVPYPKIDIIIQSTLVNAIRYADHETIYDIGTNLDAEGYRLIKWPLRAGAIQNKFKFMFIDAATKQPILSKGGTPYLTSVLNINPNGQNVYTIYLQDFEVHVNDAFLFKNDKYYNIVSRFLFE